MISKFIQKRLSLQLTLVVMLVTAGALGVSGIYRYQHQASVLETKLTQELAVSATILAASLAEPIYNYDIPSSKAICHATMKRADIVSISVEEVKSVILIFSKNESGEIVKAKYDDKVQDIEWSHKTILGGEAGVRSYQHWCNTNIFKCRITPNNDRSDCANSTS